jgi:transcription elongation factor Elf1
MAKNGLWVGFNVDSLAMNQVEHYFRCPYCREKISMLLDLSINHQTFIEDCEVCCNPIEITYDTDAESENGIAAFSSQRTQ